MAAGIPLNDDDRWPWLDVLNEKLKALSGKAVPIFLACSALRQSYRDRLAVGLPSLRFIYLKGSKELIRQRLEARKDHFMPASLLDSQFATLEEPKGAIVALIEDPLPVVIEKILLQIKTPSLQAT